MQATSICNLWAALVAPGSLVSAQPEYGQSGSKTAELLSALAESPASTSQLAEVLGLHSRAVWGLLKTPRQRGVVDYSSDSGMWSINHAYEPPAIERARAFLVANGWTCTPPEPGA